MGACDNVFCYDTESKDEAEALFDADCPDPAGCANAEGYCGCPCQFEGRVSDWASKIFDSWERAESWILHNHSKWDDAALGAFFRDEGFRVKALIGGWCAE